MKKIAIQGVPGSYHDIAAHKFFPGEEIELICCSTFEEVFANIKQDSNVIGMLAIENTIAGSLLHNYELLRESGMTIVGEHKLRIKHSFMCLPDDNWETLTEVNSHPVALAQCREFLIQHPKLKIVETEDTAGSAEAIKRENLKGHAAICSRYAADLYGMKVLEEAAQASLTESLPQILPRSFCRAADFSKTYLFSSFSFLPCLSFLNFFSMLFPPYPQRTGNANGRVAS